MNVFEDLIVELKEANLLEKTIIDTNGADAGDKGKRVDPEPEPGDKQAETTEQVATIETAPTSVEDLGYEIERADAAAARADNDAQDEHSARKPRNGNEFYKKRAVSELSNLQMVEHVLTGVEREYMKIVPDSFDDFAAKKALHTFLHVDENENSKSHAEAEFALMTETESWCSALAKRDTAITVSNLRLYCENSRPALSSQALVALARFYRNLPYTEQVRAKFDFVMTRLFSRQTDEQTRISLFTRDEMLHHINALYSEWSSIALYSAADDESNVTLTALSFEDLAIEAENTANFDTLVESGFFNRLRVFKESISEMFYAPPVTAAAIECNIRVGNAYVKLLAIERQKLDAESLQNKYGEENDQAASDAAGHTLDFVGMLGVTPSRRSESLEPGDDLAHVTPDQSRREPQVAAWSDLDEDEAETASSSTTPASTFFHSFFGNLGEKVQNVNRWFLIVSILLIVASFALYVWGNFFAATDAPSAGVSSIQVDGIAQEHVKMARVSGETLYLFMHPSWENQPKEKRLEILKSLYQTAVAENCRHVRLTNHEGKPTGYASANRLDVNIP